MVAAHRVRVAAKTTLHEKVGSRSHRNLCAPVLRYGCNHHQPGNRRDRFAYRHCHHLWLNGDGNDLHLIAFTLAGRFSPREVLPYIVSQAIGAIGASGVLRLLFPANSHLGTTLPAGTEMQSFVLELLLTFFLMLVIINVVAGSKEQGMFAGLAIGSTVLLEAMFAGPISGAGMNPIRSLAPAIVSGSWKH